MNPTQNPSPFPAHLLQQGIVGGRVKMTEAELTAMASLSALPWTKGKMLLQMQDNVKGLTILDVGGGASDITATLVEMGADAFAIDPRYKKKSEISDIIRMQLKHSGYDMPTRIAINQTLKKFMGSIDATPERYKAASATSIPFPDNTFDLLFSIDTVTAFMDIDYGILSQCFQECLRVVKPGGILRFLPFQDMQPAWPPQVNGVRMRNDDCLLQWLKANPEVENVNISKTTVKFHNLLSFRKKKV